MNIIISNNNDLPIYKQVKNQLKNSIICGDLKQGDKLPSIRVLARDLNISVITTKAAYDELESDGYVETIPAKGTYVSNKNKILIREEQLQNIESLIANSINIAKLTGIEKKEIINMLEILWEDESE